MSCELGAVSKDGLITDLAVVRQVHVGHDPVIVAHSGHAGISRGANIEGTKLSNGVAVTNYQFARLTLVFFILGDRAQRIELKNAVVFTDGGVAFDDAMRANGRTSANLDVWANDAVRANLDRGIQLSFAVDQCCRVNQTHLVPRPCLGNRAHGAHQTCLGGYVITHFGTGIEFKNARLMAV
jgi:hypothetical protein